MGEEQEAGGIAFGLGLDTSDWSAGVARARSELRSLQEAAGGLSIRTGLGGGGRGGMAVSPAFSVTHHNVRDMRAQMNQTLKMHAQQGQAVAVPIKLGRVPYAALRKEIAAGIGEVPIRIKLDPSSTASGGRNSILTAIVSATTGQTMGKAQAQIDAAGAARGIPRRWGGGRVVSPSSQVVRRYEPPPPDPYQRQPGVPEWVRRSQVGVQRGKDYTGHQRWGGGHVQAPYNPLTRRFEPPAPQDPYARQAGVPEWVRRSQAGVQRGKDYTGQVQHRALGGTAHYLKNLRAAARALQPEHMDFGKNWYPDAGAWVAQAGAAHGVPARQAIGLAAALSPGTSWASNKTKLLRVLAAKKAGKPFPYDLNLLSHQFANRVFQGEDPWDVYGHTPKVGAFFKNLSGDMDAVTLDRWAFRTATGGTHDQVAGGSRDKIEAAYRKVAKEYGLRPVELQAAVWALEKQRTTSSRSGHLGGDMAKYKAAGGPVFRAVDAARFSDALGSARQIRKSNGRLVGETVYQYPVDEYAHMRTFLSKDGLTGYAVKPDGDLVSVFNVGGKGHGEAAVRSGIRHGGMKLDAFDEIGNSLRGYHVHPNDKAGIQRGRLPSLYGKYGFHEVDREPWNEDYRPEGWSGGNPDVVYMQRMGRGNRPHGQMRLPGFAAGGHTPGSCSTCQSNVRPGHWGTKTHQDAAWRQSHPLERAYSSRREAAARAWRGLRDPDVQDRIAGVADDYDWSSLAAEIDFHGYAQRRARGGRGRRRAEGGYIVGEIGRELFVPSSMEDAIPPHVMAQLPKRASGGMAEIGGGGEQFWTPPEDGWIIPNRLMNQVPRRAEGGVASVNVVNGQKRYRVGSRWVTRSEWEDAVAAGQTRIKGGPRHAPMTPGGDVNGPNLTKDQTLRSLSNLMSHMNETEDLPNIDTVIGKRSQVLEAQYRRGLTGRARFGGIVDTALGGGKQRRAAIERDVVQGRLDKLGPLQDWEQHLHYAARIADDSAKALQAEGTTKKQATALTLKHNKALEAQAVAQTRIDEIHTLTARASTAAAAAEGGVARGLATITAGGIAFNLGMGAMNKAFSVAEKAAEPMIDRLSGWTATSQRITAQLGTQLNAAGGGRMYSTLMGQTAMQAGLGQGAMQSVSSQVMDAVIAKAAAEASAKAGDLFRAAMGSQTGASSGLYGGYGGLFGSGLGAQEMGGGTGYMENIQSQMNDAKSGGSGGAPVMGGLNTGLQFLTDSNFRNFVMDTAKAQNVDTGPVGFATDTLGNIGKGFDWLTQNFGKSFSDPTWGKTSTSSGTPKPGDSTWVATDSMLTVAQNFNDAAERGAKALGSTTKVTLRLARSAAELTAAENIMIQAGDTQGLAMAAQTGMITTVNGQVAANKDAYKSAIQQAATGTTIPTAAAWAQSVAQQLKGSFQQAGVMGAFERQVSIPGQLGQQVTANPFMAATAGTALGAGSAAELKASGIDYSKIQATLQVAQKLQDEVTQMADEGIAKQAQTIAGQEQVGAMPAGSSAQFSFDMSAVKAYGNAIAALNEDVANREAHIGLIQYNEQIRVLNRNIADAQGLISGSGGSLGAKERQQWNLQRESEQLSLQMNQRQINYQVAVAGFQAPGLTGQERAARIEEAKLQADYAQKQQDIAVQQFGLAGEVFQIQAARALEDLTHQRAIAQESFAAQQQILADQKAISALTAKEGQLQADAQSIFNQASQVYGAQVSAATSAVGQFGLTVEEATAALRNALGLSPASGGRSSGSLPPGLNHASGFLGTASSPTHAIYGEAGTETIAILRNPRAATLGAGGGGAVSMPITIQISGNNFGSMDEQKLARVITDEVETRIGAKAQLLFGRAF